MYILDTDHLVVLQKRAGNEFDNLMQRLSTRAPTEFYTTIVSFHEQIGGWQQYIAKATSSNGVVRGYTKLAGILTDFSKTQLLSFTPAAADVFDDLRQQKVRVPTMDLRIGSIAIVNQMVVLTRNTVDFARIPNLIIEDWTTTLD